MADQSPDFEIELGLILRCNECGEQAKTAVASGRVVEVHCPASTCHAMAAGADASTMVQELLSDYARSLPGTDTLVSIRILVDDGVYISIKVVPPVLRFEPWPFAIEDERDSQ